jgi:cobalt-zinc-cadmium efflux system outer membrane protein
MLPMRAYRIGAGRSNPAARVAAVLMCLTASGQPLVAQAPTRLTEPPIPSIPFRLEVPLPSSAPVGAGSQVPVRELDAEESEPRVMTLPEAEQLALARHPQVLEALAALEAARGRWLQAGLKPNPSAGYSASEIGNDGQAGQQGAYVGQTFVRGGKLQLSRAVASHEIAMRQQAIIAAEQRVLADVRVAFYDLLILQDRATILQKLVELTQQAEATAQQLFDARESPKTDYLQARIELDRMQLDVKTTRLSLGRAQQVLAARMGLEQLPAAHVAGEVEGRVVALSWQESLDGMLATHPRILQAMADEQRARCTIAREQAAVVPDLVSQGTVQYDDATHFTVVGVQAGFTLPLWNRNQGAISAAWAELRAAQQRIEQVRLDLQAQLAENFTDYAAAEQKVATYQRDILPQAAETQRLIAQAYQQGEIGFLAYLTAQRTFFEASLGYLDALKAYWTGRTNVLGMLPPVPGAG